jgi:hypothetical protein
MAKLSEEAAQAERELTEHRVKLVSMLCRRFGAASCHPDSMRFGHAN